MSSVPAPEEKAQTPGETPKLTIRVADQAGSSILFKLSPDTRLERLMDAYCERQGLERSAVRFLYDGQRLTPEDSPGKLGMEDEDVIDVFLAQEGG